MRCDQCKYYQAYLIDKVPINGMAKCFKIADSLLLLKDIYALVDDDFFCGYFVNKEKSPD